MKTKINYEKQNLVMMILLLIPSVINYVFQMVIGKGLSVEAYGITNAVLSLVGVLGVPGSIVGMIALKQIAEASTCSEQEVKQVLSVLIKCVTVLLVMMLAAGSLLAGPLSNSLHITNWIYVLCAFITASIAILRSVWVSALQGVLKLTAVGVQSLVTAIVKILLSIVALYLGFDIMGVLVAVILSEVATILFCAWEMRDYLFIVISQKSKAIEYIKKWRESLGEILIAQAVIVILSNCDMLIVKSYFSEYTAGLYSAALVVARIGLYVATIIVYTLFPVAVHQKKEGVSTKTLYIKSLIYSLVLLTLFTIFIFLFQNLIIQLMYGNEYLQAVTLFPAIFLYMYPLATLTITMNYDIAIEKGRFFSLSMLLCICLMILAAFLFHENLLGMLTILGVIMCFFAVINVYYTIKKS